MTADYATTGRARMRRTAYLICGDWNRAADITQEALIFLYVAWPKPDAHAGPMSYAPHPDASGWCYGVRLSPGIDAAVQVPQSPLARVVADRWHVNPMAASQDLPRPRASSSRLPRNAVRLS